MGNRTAAPGGMARVAWVGALALAACGPSPPGPPDTYDAVVTIQAAQDAFPMGTVKVHGDVVAPSVTGPSVADFGAVAAGPEAFLGVRLFIASLSPIDVYPPSDLPAPFALAANQPRPSSSTMSDWTLMVRPSPPGDYTAEATWMVRPAGRLMLQPGCTVTKTITVHAHLVAADGGADGGPDAAAF